jgi:hypothetical protein
MSEVVKIGSVRQGQIQRAKVVDEIGSVGITGWDV